MGLNAAVLEHVIPSLYEDKEWYDFLKAILKVADGTIWPYLKYNFESKTVLVFTDSWEFPEIVDIDGGFSREVTRADFDGGTADTDGVEADAGDALASFGKCTVPFGFLVPGEYKVVTPRVFFEGVVTQKYLDSDFIVYSEVPLDSIELMLLDNEFMANTFNLDYKSHIDGDLGFPAFSIPFSLSSYANLVTASYMRGNSIEEVEFNVPSSVLYRIYRFSATYLGNGLFYSDFKALPKASITFVDLFSVPGTNYANMEIKAVTDNVFSVAMDLSLEAGTIYRDCILRRYRGTYNYEGYYGGFKSLPENIIKEVEESIPIVILPENQSYGLSVSPTSLEFSGIASSGVVNTLQFNVYGNDSYKILTSDRWFTVLFGSSPVIESAGNRRFMVKVTENTGSSRRTGTITILGMHSNKVVISVSQNDNIFRALFSPMFMDVSAGSFQESRLTVESNQVWRVVCSNYLYGDGHLSVPNVEITAGNYQFVVNGDTASFSSSGNGVLQFRLTARSFEFDCQNGYVFLVSDTSEQVLLNVYQDQVETPVGTLNAILRRSLSVAGLVEIDGTDFSIAEIHPDVTLDGYSFQVNNHLLSNTYYTVEVVGAEVSGKIPASYQSYSSSGNGSGQLMFTVPVNSSDKDVVGDLKVLVNGSVKGHTIRFVQKAFTFDQAFVGVSATPFGHYSSTVLGDTVILNVTGQLSLQKCLRSGAYLALHLTLPDNTSLIASSVWSEGVEIPVSENSQTISSDYLIAPFDVFIPSYGQEYSSVPEVLANSECKLYIVLGELPVDPSTLPENSKFITNVVSWTLS